MPSVDKSRRPPARVRIGKRIRLARVAAQLTQSELARQTGVKASAVSQWESPAGTAPSVEHLARVATATRVRFEWIATGRGPQRDSHTAEAPAVVPDLFAQDLFEERLLQLARMLNARKRTSLIKMLEDFAG